MVFRVCKKGEQILSRRDVVRLQWQESPGEKIHTLFDAFYYDTIGREFHLGPVKIGMQGMETKDIRDELPQVFEELPDGFFSVGQDEAYYENIKDLGDGVRVALLQAMQDMAFHQELLERYGNEPVMEQALTGIDIDRKRAVAKIKGQFFRMAQGNDRLTEFHFRYTGPRPQDTRIPPVVLEFDVFPDSRPPTNVHALIGRNGCGKTYLIKQMVQCLQDQEGKHGEFTYKDGEGQQKFANVVCIAFSPFDNLAELINPRAELPATYVGLDKEKGDLRRTIEEQFMEHFRNCLLTQRKRMLWRRAIRTLTCDSVFRDAEIESFMDEGSGQDPSLTGEQDRHIRSVFDGLSSGHKVVLLIVTGCVAEVEERTIVLLDEPENHLHPPLLSALIRALSDLLRDRNGVAIVSTHSPVVLQEVPRKCVWLLTRNGKEYVKPERLPRETFGTSVGALIDDAFAFEVQESGFHKMMVEAASRYETFEEVLEQYKGQLGDEAGILLKMLMHENRWEVL